MKIRCVILALLVVAASSSTAFALGKGTSMVAIELTNGTADLAGHLSGPDYIGAFSVPEIGVQGQLWHLLADDYAFALSGGFGFSNEKDEPGTGAPASSPDEVFKTSSFNVRVGGDRVVKVAERAVMYGGPGIEFWSGKAKQEAGTVSSETETTTRISLSARIGATLVLNDRAGLTMQVGHRVGRASSDDSGAKATWWASGFDGAMGLSFTFSGE